MQGISDADRVVSLFLRLKDCAREYKQLTENRGKTFIILASLREYELKNGRHLTVGDIAENSGLALPNVSRLLAPAEKQGLIRREKCGRNVNVTLTEEGEKKLAGWLDDFWRDIALALKALTPEETEAFATGFEKILDSFEKRIAPDKNNGERDAKTVQES